MGLFNKLFKKQPDDKDAKADIKAAASRNENEKKGRKSKQEKEPGSAPAAYLPANPVEPRSLKPTPRIPEPVVSNTPQPALFPPVNPAQAANLQWENVYVFISSTFNDMHAERDYLVKRVFPELSEWCAARKLHLVDIDLRWGVTEADSEKNKRVVEVCLNNIDKCRPFFLCFLGQRRGWVPGREDISEGTFHSFYKLKDYLGSSVTEMEIIHALIDPMLNGSITDLQKQEQAFFFLRDPQYLQNITNQFLRNIYTNEGEADPPAADRALAEFKDKVIGQCGRPVYHYTARWDKESTTPELASANPAADPDRQDITQGRLVEFACKGDTLAAAVLTVLKEAIENRYPGRNLSEADTTPLQYELDQQAQFLQLAAEGFIPRSGDFDKIFEYIRNDERRPFALCASAGLGKTSFLARFIEELLSQAHIPVVYRFVGVSEESWSLHRLLASILQELKTAGRIKSELPVTAADIKNKFSDFLEQAAANGKLVIIIDALNQLESGLDDLTWLHWQLPPNIKLVFSFKLGEEKGENLARSLALENKALLDQVKPFETLADRKSLVAQYLSHFLKELDEDNIETIINSQGAVNPLFLKVLLSELRVFGSHNNLRELIKNRFGQTPLSAFEAVLERIEKDPAYSAVEPLKLVPHIFGWLTHSKNGLSVTELAELLLKSGLTEDYQAAFDAVQLLLRQLRPYLSRRDGRIDFFYESFFLAACKRYTLTHSFAKPDAEWHRDLVGYFAGLSPTAPRYLSEIAYQYAHAGMAGELCGILLDYHFIESHLQNADVAAVIEDFSYAQIAEAQMCKEDKTALALIGDALSLASGTLAKNPAQLPTQLFGRLLGFDLPQIRCLLDGTLQYLQKEGRPWLRPLAACMPAPGGALLRTYSPISDNICIFKDRQHMLVSSKTDASIKMVEIKTGKVIRNYPLDSIPGARYMNDFLLLEDEKTFAIRISGTLYLVDIDTARSRIVPGFTGSPRRIMFSKGNILLSHDRTTTEYVFKLNVVDVNRGEIIHTFYEGLQNTSTGFGFNADVSLLLAGTDDNRVSVFDVKNNLKLLYKIGTHPKYVTDICLLEEAGLLITKTAENQLYLWRMEDEKLLLNTLLGFGEAFLVSHDGKTLVLGNFGRLDFYSLESFTRVQRIEGNGDKVNSLLFSADDNRLFVGRYSGLVECWDTTAYAKLAAYKEHTAYPGLLALSSDETCLVSGGLAAGVCVWDLLAAPQVKNDEGMRALQVTSIDLAADDTFLLSIDEKGNVQKVQTQTMLISDVCSVQGVSVPEIFISKDCVHFAVRTRLNEVKIFETATGELAGSFTALNPYDNPDMAQIWGPRFLAPEACLSSRNVSIVSYQGGKIIVQDIDNPDSPRIIDAFEGRISWFKLYNGGRKLIVFSTGNEACPLVKLNQKQGFESGAKIYDTVTWECILHTADHLAAYFSMAGIEEYEEIKNYLRSSFQNLGMKSFIPLVDCLQRNEKHILYLRKKLYDRANRFPFRDTAGDREITDFEVEGNVHEHLFSRDGRNIFLYGYGKVLYPLYFENPPFYRTG